MSYQVGQLKYADNYTYTLVRPLPKIRRAICESDSFRRRAFRCQLLAKVFDFLSISVLGALWQSHLRLRGSVSIFGDSQIPSTAATQQLDILWNKSSYVGSLLGTTLWFAADSDRAATSSAVTTLATVQFSWPARR